MNDIKIIMNEFYDYLKKEKRFSTHTIDAYRNDLDRFISSFPKTLSDLNEINKDMIYSFLSKEFDNNFKSKTIARRLASIKSLFKYLIRSEQISENPSVYVKTPKINKRLPNFVDVNLIDELMKQPQISESSESKALRDRAILELFYSTGIRLSELINLNISSISININKEKNEESYAIKVLGKRNKERLVPFGNTAKSWLEVYLNSRGLSFYILSNDVPLFVNTKEKRVGYSTIKRRIRKYIESVAEGNNLGPHILRHSFATHLIDRGVGIREVQELLGHSTLSSTQIYTHIKPERMKEIHANAHPHGQNRRKNVN